MRRILIAFAATSGALALLGAGAVHADSGASPVVSQWSPQTVSENGQPLRITIVGTNLGGVNQVFTTPVLTQRSVAVVSDQAVIVTLPGDIPAGAYALQLVSPSGSTLPGGITVTVLAAAAKPQAGGRGSQPAAPPVSLQPAPVAVEASPRAVAPGGAAPASAQPQGAPVSVGVSGGTNPFVILAVGIAVGGLLYVLWGKEGRLRLARRQGLLMQLWARPLQRLHLARICLQCGKLHYVVQTRRDLWAAGDFCSASCFVADQEAERDLASSEGVAPTRLRGVGVYAELESTLQSALRAEALEHAAALFDSEASHHHNPALVPLPSEPGDGVKLTA